MQQLDFVNVITLLATLFFTPELSSVIGPYTAIIIAATSGAAIGLSRRSPESRWGAFWFYLRMNVLAALLTITVCNLLETYVFRGEVKWLLIPVALGIGWVGDDWPAVLTWAAGFGKKLILRWASEKENSGA